MTEIRFYHLTRRSVEQALPELLEKSLERGWRAVVKATSEARAEALAGALWTESPERFIPHGTSKDGWAEDQPAWITHGDERPNDATVLFLVDGESLDEIAGYGLVCAVFSGSEPEQEDSARQTWRQFRAQGHQTTYWEETEAGWRQRGL